MVTSEENKVNGQEKKPLVSILLSVYKPNEKWLNLQLDSLNNQSYKNLELIIWDDCPDFPTDEEIFKTHITNFKYKLYRGEKNLGSNKAFERLTELAGGDYLAYCDQDDIWCENKIEMMISKFHKTNALLVYSDVKLIDGDDKVIGNSIKEIYIRHEFLQGKNLASKLILRNCVIGCAMMVNSKTAKACIPFEDSFIHDQWIAINAALNGEITLIQEPTIFYRRHIANQTGVLSGISSKKSYIDIKISSFKDRIDTLKSRFKDEDELKQILSDLEKWTNARVRYLTKFNIKDFKIMHKYKHFGKQSVLLETFMPFMPNFVFKKLIKLAQKGAL